MGEYINVARVYTRVSVYKRAFTSARLLHVKEKKSRCFAHIGDAASDSGAPRRALKDSLPKV